MDSINVVLVSMFGPSISDPSKIVNRDVPAADVQAYRAAGYQEGSFEAASEEGAPEVEVVAKPAKAKKGKK